MASITGQASGRYGNWVLEVVYTTSPVSSGKYFNVHAELYFQTTGTATIYVSARPGGAYLNLNGNVRYYDVSAFRGSGRWFIGSHDITVGADANGNCSFGIDSGYNVRANLEGNYVAWINASGTGTNSGMGGITPNITSFSFGAKTDTTQMFNWNSNINSDYANIQLNGQDWGNHSFKEGSTLRNLQPNTNYSLYIRAHNSYGYGGWSGAYTFKTFPKPVTVSNITIVDVTPFGCTVSASSSDANTTNAIEYSIYDSTGTQLIQGPYVMSPVQWIYYIENLTPETTYTVKVRVRTSDSNIWSDYSTSTFTTQTDQASVYIKKDGKWEKGKLYIKIDGVWTPAKKVYIKTAGAWTTGINT